MVGRPMWTAPFLWYQGVCSIMSSHRSLWHLYKSSEGFSFNLDGDELVMKYALEEGDGLSEVRLERQGE